MQCWGLWARGRRRRCGWVGADDGDVRGPGLLGDVAAWRAVMLGLRVRWQLREVQRHRG